jgi:hypothetical protein
MESKPRKSDNVVVVHAILTDCALYVLQSAVLPHERLCQRMFTTNKETARVSTPGEDTT